MSCSNLSSYTITESGVIRPVNPPVDPVVAKRGWGGRVVCVHAVPTTAGTLKLRDGITGSAKLIATIPLATGFCAVEPKVGAWHFIEGVYAEFADSLAGRVMITLG